MRILHTSDWHLGRTLHGVDLLEHQAGFLDHLVELVRSEDVGAVVVSGDVYDRAVPPVEAVQLLADALTRLSERAPVVVTPGNHDSAIRLGFAAGLMREGVHLRARVADVGRPVVLADEHGPVVVHALPYLDPDTVRRALADDAAPDGLLPRSHEAVLAAAMRRVRADLEERAAGSGHRPRSVVMAHAFVVGGLASESERDVVHPREHPGGGGIHPAHPDVPLGLRGQAAHHERMRHQHAARPVACLLYTSPSPRDRQKTRMPSSA